MNKQKQYDRLLAEYGTMAANVMYMEQEYKRGLIDKTDYDSECAELEALGEKLADLEAEIEGAFFVR